MSAALLLSEIIAQLGGVSAAQFELRPGYSALQHGELLRETGLIQSIVCEDCDLPHDADIVFDDGVYGHYCPDLGFLEVDRAQLIRLAPDMAAVVAMLADTFECKRRKSSPVMASIWRIGAVATGAGDIMIYLHPRLQGRADLDDLNAALAREVQSPYRLVRTGSGGLAPERATVAQLHDVVSFDDAFTPLSDLRVVVGAPLELRGGRPPLHKDRLKQITADREQTGCALKGVNEEAKAVLQHCKERFPNDPAPSLPTAKRYITAHRRGS